jgi:Flp pilus assembly protein TadD
MTRWTFLRGLALASCLVSLTPALAQEPLELDPMAQARTAEARRDPAEALSRYLRALAANPRRLDALMGAGRSALAIGDANAALAFYARAEEVDPRNGAVKAGLGSALVQLEQARPALRMFDDAVDLGIPPATIAGDRGLAYDLRGDNERAQRDYMMALRDRHDPETVRRLALSLAISGNREAAMQTLDPLLRRQDIAAWRARAFILAMTGDPAGAERAAYQVMPRLQAAALAPFLEKLPTLKPAQKAAAVHFGHFPSSGRSYSQAELFADAAPGRPAPDRPGNIGGPDKGLIPQGEPLGRNAEDGKPTAPVSKAPRRRPGATDDGAAAQKDTLRLDVLPPATPQPTRPTAKKDSARLVSPPAPPLEERAPAKRLVVEPGIELMGDSTAMPKGKSKPVVLAQASAPKAAEPKKGEKSDKSERSEKSEKAASKGDAKAKADKTRLASEEEAKASDKGKDKQDKKDSKDKKKSDAKEAAKPIGKERYWVQVAGGANKADLPRAFAKLKEKWPRQLSGRNPYTTRLRATNRLLIGPFKTAEDAQDWVNGAKKDGFATFPYTSPADVEVEKLASK